jgi:formylglycine-generating enzyme required for sulfatase activity
MRIARFLFLTFILVACAPPPTPVVVTLTVAPPTPTIAPVSLVAPMQSGSTMLYADGTTLLAVPSGSFLMGHGKADNPEHTVTLSDYWIYATKITNAQYALCVVQERCTAPDGTDNPAYSAFGAGNQPVVGVTYDQAVDYCNFMDASLPTEAQWEKVARGAEASLYPWGDAAPSCDLLNFNNCEKHVTDVTHYAAGVSPYGAFDMEGNAYEWVADWYDPLYYKQSPPGDPPGPATGKARVQRGSSYRSNPAQAVAYARSFASPHTHDGDLGFRCVVTDPSYFAPACQLSPAMSGSELAALSVECPQISIDVKVTACRYGGGALVTFNDDHASDPNASFGGIVGCTLVSGAPGSYPLSYQCRKGSTAVISTKCSYAGIPDASCPAHYQFDSSTGVCQWMGERTNSIECPTGDFYDPVHHCCMVSTGNIADDPVCPVGTVFTEAEPGRYFCLPAGSALDAPRVQAAINPPVCPGACELTPDSCTQRNLVFCSTTCACLSATWSSAPLPVPVSPLVSSAPRTDLSASAGRRACLRRHSFRNQGLSPQSGWRMTDRHSLPMNHDSLRYPVAEVKPCDIWTHFGLDARTSVLYHGCMALHVPHSPGLTSCLCSNPAQIIRSSHHTKKPPELPSHPAVASAALVSLSIHVPVMALGHRLSLRPPNSLPVRFEPHLNYSLESRVRRVSVQRTSPTSAPSGARAAQGAEVRRGSVKRLHRTLSGSSTPDARALAESVASFRLPLCAPGPSCSATRPTNV